MKINNKTDSFAQMVKDEYKRETLVDIARETDLTKDNLLEFILNSNKNNSFVIFDPKSALLQKYNNTLTERGYDVRVLDFDSTINYKDKIPTPLTYNPFEHATYMVGVCALMRWIMDCYIAQCKKYGDDSIEPELIESAKTLLSAIALYLIKYTPAHQRNFESVAKMLQTIEIDGDYRRPMLDRLFEQITERDPDSDAVEEYKKFSKQVAGDFKKRQKVIELCLNVFHLFRENQYLKDFTRFDTIAFDGYDYDNPELFDGQRVALFVIPPEFDIIKKQTFITRELLTSILFLQLSGDMHLVDPDFNERYNVRRIKGFSNSTIVINNFSKFSELPYSSEILSRLNNKTITLNFNGGIN